MSPFIVSLLMFASGLAAMGIKNGDPLDPALYSFSFVALGLYAGLLALLHKNFRKVVFLGILLLILPSAWEFFWEFFFVRNREISRGSYVFMGISAGCAVAALAGLYAVREQFGEKRTKLWVDALIALPLLVVPAVGANVAVLYFWNIKIQESYNFVPKDAVYIIESNDPINDWKEFSGSAVWKHMKQNPTFGYITEMADWLDDLISQNSTTLGVLKNKQLIISAHMTEANNYDFLYLMNLGEGAKVSHFMDGVNGMLDKMGYVIKKDKNGGHETWAFGDGKYFLYLTFRDNMMMASYTRKLVDAAYAQADEPWFTKQEFFRTVVKRTTQKGNCRVYLNYERLLPYLRMYMTDPGETAVDMTQILDFTGLDVSVGNDYGSLTGYTQVSDSVYSLLGALRNVPPSPFIGAKVMPDNMSFFTRIGFSNFTTFYGFLWEDLKQDKESFEQIEKMKNGIEKYSKISLEKDLLGWVGTEIMVGTMPVSRYGDKQAYVAFMEAKDSTFAQEKMDYVVKKLKNKTGGLKFEKSEYRGYPIRYLEAKGLFRLFFGKMFRKFEHPHYLHLGDYVVFSNDTAALHRIVDKYLLGETLANDQRFRQFMMKFKPSSNYFIYFDTHDFYPWLPTFGNPSTQFGIRKNKKYITCFPQAGFELVADNPGYDTHLFVEFDPSFDPAKLKAPEPEEIPDEEITEEPVEDTGDNESNVEGEKSR